MNQEEKKLPRVSRADEEQYLAETIRIVRQNTKSYSEQVAKMQSDIDDMLEHYHDNDVESLTDLNNTVTLHEHMKRTLDKNKRALKKPYFGRIIFQDETLSRQESLYIGRGGIVRDTIHPVVVDWRAPVANAYYESNLGRCSYTAPGGQEMPIDLQLKRTFEIEDGTLKDYFDSEVIANDELLTKYLAKNKQAVLGEIVATIQKEQNEIIRLTPYRNLIVQGVAGSGKTTVAMHRISYILYNYAEHFRPDDFYIVGSNRILLNYITGVLPELDVSGVRQMTMEQLFTRLLYEEWDEKKYRICAVRGDIRGSLGWFEDLKAFCDRLEWNYLAREDIYLDEGQSGAAHSSLRRSPTVRLSPGQAPSARRSRDADGRTGRVLLLGREAIEKYIRQNPAVSLQNKIDGLNERLLNQVHNHFLEHIGRYTGDEQKAILKSFRGWFGGRNLKLSIFSLYNDFLAEQQKKGFDVPARAAKLDVYDLAALAYLYARTCEKEVIQEAHHVVIDEAQDFGMMVYSVLNFCLRGCTYTIMGDVSQNIRFGSGLNDWEELRALLIRDETDSFRTLKKSYRNTIEISNYASRILRHGTFSIYPVEPIIRHGNPVQEVQETPPPRKVSGKADSQRTHLIRKAAQILSFWQSQGYGTLAVICRDAASASRTADELGEFLPVIGSRLEDAVFGEGIMVLPVEYTKGLEFDAVLLFNPTRQDYPVDNEHAKLLYVAATRALHELCVLYDKDLTGLIAEEPAKAEPVYQKEGGVSSPAFQKKTTVEPTSLFFSSGKSLQMPDLYDAENILKKARAGQTLTPPIAAGGETSTKLTSTKLKRTGGQAPARPQPSFGQTPPPDSLRPPGHGRIDLAVRWSSRQPDGLCLQSRYGVLRLSPVTSRIIRVTFAKLGQMSAACHPKIAVQRQDKAWMYREIGGFIELLTDELCLRVNKSTGAVQYMTRDRMPLLTEQAACCRQMEAVNDVSFSAWLYLDWAKKESLTAANAECAEARIPLRGRAGVISPDNPKFPFPLIVSDAGYGLLIAAESGVVCCDLPSAGSYIQIRKCGQLDFYFLRGETETDILKLYEYLCRNA